MSAQKSLSQIRKHIDAIDSEILSLLNKRARCAEEVAIVKRSELNQSDKKICFYRPEREAQILRRMLEANKGPLRDEQIAFIYRGIISSCLALEERLKIAYLGPQGTFTEMAVNKHFGQWVETTPRESVANVFDEVQKKHVSYGVVPIENSTGGTITHTLDMLMTTPLTICGEIYLRIHQNLLSINSDWKQAKKVYAHGQTLIQCQYWLEKNLPNASPIAVSSNAEGARLAKSDPQSVAIAGESAAVVYDLPIVKRNIEDLPDNTTRFLVVSYQKVLPSGNDKTTIMLSVKNKPGSLYNLLKPFSDNGLDLSHIESRPSRNANWEYVFFIDIKEHVDSPSVKKALIELGKESNYMHILGSYPRAID